MNVSSLFRFALLSVSSLALNLGVTTLLVEYFELYPVIANFLALVLVMIWNFTLLRHAIFPGSTAPWGRQFTEFCLTTGIFRCVELVAFWLLFEFASLPYQLTILLVSAGAFGIKYVFYANTLFRSTTRA